MKGRKAMFRTLFLTFIAVIICGCQSYQDRTDIRGNIERIQVKKISSNNRIASNLITNSLKVELANYYTIVENDPDIIISGSGQIRYDILGIPMINHVLLHIDTPNGSAGTIKSSTGWVIADGPNEFAKKIKNILTKRR